MFFSSFATHISTAPGIFSSSTPRRCIFFTDVLASTNFRSSISYRSPFTVMSISCNEYNMQSLVSISVPSTSKTICLYFAIPIPPAAFSNLFSSLSFFVFQEIPLIVSCILFFFISTLITFTSTTSPTLTASRGCLI